MSLSKEHIHTQYGQKLRVRVCGILIKNDSILLVKHHSLGEEGVLWAPPGGGVEFGESVEEALKREFLEEVGIEVAIEKFLFTHEFLEPPLHAIELFFEVRHLNGQIKKGKDPEMNDQQQLIQDVTFLSLAQLKAIKKAKLHHVLIDVEDWKRLLKPSLFFWKN